MSHIAVWRHFWPSGYWHHGIECEDGTVIHFANPSGGRKKKSNARITRTSMEKFIGSGGGDVYDIEYDEATEQVSDAETVQKRAESQIGEAGYDVVLYNCESFSRWCVTGRADCLQIRELKGALGVAVPVFGPVLGVLACLIFVPRWGIKAVRRVG